MYDKHFDMVFGYLILSVVIMVYDGRGGGIFYAPYKYRITCSLYLIACTILIFWIILIQRISVFLELMLMLLYFFTQFDKSSIPV